MRFLSLSTFCTTFPSSFSNNKSANDLGNRLFLACVHQSIVLSLEMKRTDGYKRQRGGAGRDTGRGERHRLIYNLTNTQRLPKPGVPALTRCHFNSRRRLHWNTDKRQNSSLCKGFRKLFTTAWREINVIRELHYNHTCFITAHSNSGNICELRALKPHEIEIRVLWLLVDGFFFSALKLFG